MQKIAIITDNSCDLTLETMEQNNIELFPLRIIGYIQGVIILETAKMVQAGNFYKELIETLPKILENFIRYYTLDTLQYLIKSGRIEKLAGIIGIAMLMVYILVRLTNQKLCRSLTLAEWVQLMLLY